MKPFAAFFFLFFFILLTISVPAQERTRCINSYDRYCNGASTSTSSRGKWIGWFSQTSNSYSSSSGISWQTCYTRGYNLFGYWHGKVISTTIQQNDTVYVETQHYRLGKRHGSFKMSYKGKMLVSGRYKNGIRSLQTEYDSTGHFITAQEVLRDNTEKRIRLGKKKYHQEWRTFREGKIYSKRILTFDFKKENYVSTDVFYNRRGKEASYEACKSSWGD